MANLKEVQNAGRDEYDGLALQHVEALDKKAAQIPAMSGALRQLVGRCHGDDRPQCPIIDNLAASLESGSWPPAVTAAQIVS